MTENYLQSALSFFWFCFVLCFVFVFFFTLENARIRNERLLAFNWIVVNLK